MLAVVEDEQEIAVGEEPAQRVRRRRPGQRAHAEHSRCLVRHVLGPGCGGQVDKPYAIAATTDLPSSQLERQTGLPDTAGPGEGGETAAPHDLHERLQLASAADQRGQRHWQVCGAGRQLCRRHQCRNHRRGSRGRSLASAERRPYPSTALDMASRRPAIGERGPKECPRRPPHELDRLFA